MPDLPRLGRRGVLHIHFARVPDCAGAADPCTSSLESVEEVLSSRTNILTGCSINPSDILATDALTSMDTVDISRDSETDTDAYTRDKHMSEIRGAISLLYPVAHFNEITKIP